MTDKATTMNTSPEQTITERNQEVSDMLVRGVRYETVAERFDLSLSTLRKIASVYEVQRLRDQFLADKLKELANKGFGIIASAARAEVSVHIAARISRKHGITFSDSRPGHFLKGGSYKIIARLQSGVSLQKIADEAGLTLERIRQIREMCHEHGVLVGMVTLEETNR